MRLRERRQIGDLCNGSTPDSDSVCGGSNPSSPAKITVTSFDVAVIFIWRDSNPERVSGVKKTVRWTVFRREVRSSYAARTDDAKRSCRGIIPHPLPKIADLRQKVGDFYFFPIPFSLLLLRQSSTQPTTLIFP